MKQETLQLTGGNTNDNRRALDFYPTPSNATIALMNFLELNNIIPKGSQKTIWEPACGNGAMADIIRTYGHVVMASDIAEECDINGSQMIGRVYFTQKVTDEDTGKVYNIENQNCYNRWSMAVVAITLALGVINQLK